MSSENTARVGVIGGSGLYDLPGLEILDEERVETPFGAASDRFLTGRLHGTEVVFLPRHGRGHRFLPTEINFRGNIYGFKKLGVSHLISVSAVGSMKEAYAPGHIVLPDQFFDRTKHRADTFFGDGLVAHVSLAEPTCPVLRSALSAALPAIGATCHDGGTYLCIEGPQFSTRAESMIYRQWGVDVIGMTNMQEAKLCREAEICYACMALITDYDCWHDGEEDVTTEGILRILEQNVDTARRAIDHLLLDFDPDRRDGCGCAHALDSALLTRLEDVPQDTIENLRPLLQRLL